MKLLTVGQMARSANVSRTSLLYYERLGLVRPSSRSSAGYRLYGQAEADRLRALRIYREAGVPIREVRELLASGLGESAAILERRLLELDRQVKQLRLKQRLLARLLAQPFAMGSRGIRTKAQWVSLLRSAGFADNEMNAWHRSFELEAPEEHQEFLASLGMPAQAIDRVRAWSRSGRGIGT
jgi:DNA-binding transcriptional MerR regulator